MQQYLEAGKVAILVSSEPASAMVMGILCYGENPTVLSVLGLLCTIGSVVLLNQLGRTNHSLQKNKVIS